MVNFGKMIDKLIEISTNQDLSDEVKFQLDEVNFWRFFYAYS